MNKAPKEIYLNINDDHEMPPFDEIAWDEVTWSANRPAVKQAILYISYDALSKWDDEMKAIDARNQKLESIVKELAEFAEYWSEYDVPLGIVDRIKDAVSLPNSDVRCHSDTSENREMLNDLNDR